MDILNIIIGIFQAFINWLSNIIFGRAPTTTTPEPTTTTPEPTTTTPEPTTTTPEPTTTTPEPTTTTPEPTTTTVQIATMDLSPGIAKMDLSSGIANMDLSNGIANMDLSPGIASMNLFQTFGTTTPPPPTQKPILDAIKSLLTLKNDGNGTNYTLNGVYDGKDVELIDKNRIDDYLLDKPKYVYKTNEIVEFTFTNTAINQDYKIKLRILNSSLEYGAYLVSSVKFMATTAVEIPVAPSVYTSLKLNDGIIKVNNDGVSKQYTLLGTYDDKSVTLLDKNDNHIAYFDNPVYVYKVNEIAEFTFTNPISNQDSKVNLKITKANTTFDSNFNMNYTFNSILSPPVAENYQNLSIGVF